MPNIYVNTDNSNLQSKIYKAGKAGKSAAAAEKKMQETVRAVLAKTGGFSTDTSAAAKGYTIRIEVTQATSAGNATTYTLHPELVRYPASGSKGGKGDEMVSTLTKDPTIRVEGTSEALLLDGVEAATENIVAKCIPLMRMDMTRR